MKILKKLAALVIIGTIGASLVACGSSKESAKTDSKEVGNKNIVIGVCPGPYGDMVKEALAPALKAKGYTVSTKEFSDYIQPDKALDNKEIDANLFQHTEYLKKFSSDNNLKISPVIVVPTLSMGVFSNTIKSLDQLKDGAKIAIPNDASNLARALKLLKENGIIKLKENIDETKATEKDVAENPKNIKFTPIEGAQLARSIDSVDLAVVPGNFAFASKLDYSKAVAVEKLAENYKNVVAVRTEDLDKDLGKDLKEAVQSKEFKDAIENGKFKEFSKPDWWK
ncbi:D-methionine transport system substrate-binding protein [Clostridium saccharoperbutylacetonicum]|uniref:Lipoprotein n=1 Tax=Clostridium saccharoperbutylacetonicum N1-4(HMT) TaxID=931276 RepID=M1MCS9_9CLOT|nr:MetQ/NlpA family ABC transporter substrate-binding protein [Clostridium saccharoperbutylacetonicum]AGF55704.1 methionine-binding lipoprotein MetQ [Clostridium saccharoperbutylacetonicum N1-4(HMT)]NRT63567.1 D-methionine transport system substrate-binding protein [Clostridium saccharoperbutylacetonicum]NSB26930.1 D-methionine transport system substrate-binding protein [Clostridium saccharoperbutylacetonicum]NSB40414.1 D-methionine transport system substrate-binding protein [Clostridium saccha